MRSFYDQSNYGDKTPLDAYFETYYGVKEQNRAQEEHKMNQALNEQLRQQNEIMLKSLPDMTALTLKNMENDAFMKQIDAELYRQMQDIDMQSKMASTSLASAQARTLQEKIPYIGAESAALVLQSQALAAMNAANAREKNMMITHPDYISGKVYGSDFMKIQGAMRQIEALQGMQNKQAGEASGPGLDMSQYEGKYTPSYVPGQTGSSQVKMPPLGQTKGAYSNTDMGSMVQNLEKYIALSMMAPEDRKIYQERQSAEVKKQSSQMEDLEQVAFKNASIANQAIQVQDEFKKHYDKTWGIAKGPVGGPVFGWGASDYQTAKSLSESLISLLAPLDRVPGQGDITNFALQGIKESKVNPNMMPDTVEAIYQSKRAGLERLSQFPAFIEIAKANGFDANQISQMWENYYKAYPTVDLQGNVRPENNFKLEEFFKGYYIPENIRATTLAKRIADSKQNLDSRRDRLGILQPASGGE